MVKEEALCFQPDVLDSFVLDSFVQGRYQQLLALLLVTRSC